MFLPVNMDVPLMRTLSTTA